MKRFTIDSAQRSLKSSGFDPRQRQRIFPPASVSRPTQPPIQWVPAVICEYYGHSAQGSRKRFSWNVSDDSNEKKIA
jgi:hypothetical protein